MFLVLSSISILSQKAKGFNHRLVIQILLWLISFLFLTCFLSKNILARPVTGLFREKRQELKIFEAQEASSYLASVAKKKVLSSSNQLTHKHLHRKQEKDILEPCSKLASCLRLAESLLSQKKHQQIFPILEPYTDKLPALLLLEKAYLGGELYELQIQTLELILSQFKPEPKYYFRLAQAQLALRKKKSDIQNIRKKSHLTPQDQVKLNLKRENEAIKNLRKSIELNSRFQPAYQALIELFLEKKEAYEGLMITQDRGKIFGKDATHFALLCQFYSMRGLFQDTVENCDKAIQLFPTNPSYYYYKMQAYQKTADKKTFINLLHKWASLFPENAFVQEKVGHYYLKAKSFQLAFRHLSKSIELSPQSALSQLAFAKTAFALKKYDKALQAFVAVCRLTQRTPMEFKESASLLRRDKRLKDWAHKYNLNLQNCLTDR